MKLLEKGKKLSFETVVGLYAVVWSLMGVLGAVHAVTHEGISSLVGWGSVVTANVLVFSTSRYWEGKERLSKDRTFLIAMSILIVILAVMITDIAGVWDAR